MRWIRRQRGGMILLLLAGLFLLPGISRAWGGRAHRWINRQAFGHLPQEMAGFQRWAGIVVAYASEADRRKSSDILESPRHYIDIDRYPEFHRGRLCHDLDSLKAQYGERLDVYGNGVVPWTIAGVTETLSVAMAAGRWQEAILRAADLGHYVADCHQPLHTTENYDGQLTGNDGVHLRYEISMVNRHLDQLPSDSTEAQYVPDPLEYIFGTIPGTWIYVDSIMAADRLARKKSSVFDDEYYRAMWQRTGRFTCERISQAARVLADLWYTAWVDAGRPEFPPPAQPEPIAGLNPEPGTQRLVTVQGVVTIGSGILDHRQPRAYLQDASGRGILLLGDIYTDSAYTDNAHTDGLRGEEIERGDRVTVEGIVREYGGATEIVGPSVTVLERGCLLPDAPRLTTCQARDPRWDHTLIQISGSVVFILEERGWTRLHVDDGSGAVVVMIAAETGIELSRLQEGDVLTVRGVGARLVGEGDRAIMPGYADGVIMAKPGDIDSQDLEKLKAIGYID
jgi:hypothetical protein